ncbi:hypothetical protein NUW54_g7909 [Trametes sanguinea]|uniref:Uncharacterized protein n=1 Tax=Trametes sanguinea TaxID=158606 RepID=A0ACC1PI03_9APHY|nr:hypothetical protein NUW54_g7909 [Trametes sanguinea]
MASQFCPATLYAGGCDAQSCPLKHDVKFCTVCAIVCAPASVFDAHARGRQHQSNLAASSSSSWLRCGLCNIVVSGHCPWVQHLAGASHIRKARAKSISPAIYPSDPVVPNAYRCIVCQKAIPINSWRAHLLSAQHLRQQTASAFRAKFERSQQDRRGVVVSHAETEVNFGVINRPDAQAGVRLEVTVKTERSTVMSLTKAECFGAGTQATSCFSASIVGGARQLRQGQVIRVAVTFRQALRGRYQGRLELTLNDGTTRPFVIIRQLRAVVGNADDHQLLKAAAPYSTSTAEVACPRLDDGRTSAPGPRCHVLAIRSTNTAIAAIRSNHLPKTLSATTHAQHFQTLLHIEEQRLVEDLRLYDLADVTFRRDGTLYALTVPGLAERRPSVVIGDTLEVQRVTGGDHTYRGYVHAVRLQDVLVSFHGSFNASGQYNVRFQYNRTPIKRQHQALLATSTSAERLLFPGAQHVPLDRAVRSGELSASLFNGAIGRNPAQLQAVTSILHMQTGAAPFIVFGPPGTGKTVVVVEAILQLLRSQPNARILACAPSNSAADLLAQRLTSLSTSVLFRCNAIFRNKATLPEELVPYSSFRDNHFSLPELTTLLSYKVIVSTCGNASFAYNIGMPLGHFTHIFIDEAGQGSEPEVLTAGIKTMVSKETRVILSGDPKQLGPVIRSSIARDLGLDKSYLERLMERPLYSDAQTGRGHSYIKLTKNFRSHRAILAYPNNKFYEGELEVAAAPSQIDSFIGSAQLVNPKFPVIFHAIFGENERESTSPSYFNIDEATEVVEYVKELLKDRQHPVRSKDIGIITPYFAQGSKIRKLLQKANITDLKVSTVEEFQGQVTPFRTYSLIALTSDDSECAAHRSAGSSSSRPYAATGISSPTMQNSLWASFRTHAGSMLGLLERKRCSLSLATPQSSPSTRCGAVS